MTSNRTPEPKTTPESPLSSEVLDFVRSSTSPSASIQEIAGDASTRRFFRVTDAGKSSILMVHGEPLGPDAGLFSNHRVLEAIGAPVPRLLSRNEGLGLALVEDFGDLSLQRCAIEAFESKTAGADSLYGQACDLIVLMQGRAPSALRPDDFAARHALDRERFLFELRHFDTHFVRGLRRMTPSAGEQALLGRFYADLAEACDRLPRAYCHRDYQSRNLMVRDQRIGLIDFQDARMGPYTYDAASLLRDSSLDLPPDLAEVMLDLLAEDGGARFAVGPEEFRRDFDLMALQRNIKDLGTFGYMAGERGRTAYLDFVPRTVESIRRTMTTDPRYHEIYGPFARLALDPR